jgi:predicted nucleic acid-binding protein
MDDRATIMPGDVFLDTNGWLALLNASDSLHASATEAWLTVGRSQNRIVLTDWIVAETGNGLARAKATSRFGEAVERVLESARAEIVFVDQSLLEQAVQMYHHHSDKSWGLVDCASFLVMRDRGLTDVFTCDRHFEQAGFRRLLKGPSA